VISSIVPFAKRDYEAGIVTEKLGDRIEVQTVRNEAALEQAASACDADAAGNGEVFRRFLALTERIAEGFGQRPGFVPVGKLKICNVRILPEIAGERVQRRLSISPCVRSWSFGSASLQRLTHYLPA
jgi:hypothetical protein